MENEQELYKNKISSSDIDDSAQLFEGDVVDDENINNSEIKPEVSSFDIVPINPGMLISQAIDKGTDIGVMERLLAMRKELKAEAARDEYFKAFAAFQSECPIIEKRKKVYDKNGKYRYSYAPLEDIVSQVKSLLLKHGFSYTITTEQTSQSVTSICKVHHVMGHETSTSLSIPIDETAYMNIAQKVASALTFSKRYSFCDAFGIMTMDEDDDSNITGEPGQKQKPSQTTAQDHYNNKSKNKKQTINDAPEQNRALYASVMALFREKSNGITILTPEEMKKYKANADLILFDYDKLVEFYKSINKLVQQRRTGV